MLFDAIPTPVQARHTEVVPSFVLPWIRRPLSTRIGRIEPHELVHWEHFADLPQRVRADLRAQILKRLRGHAEEVWASQTQVRITDGWASGLLPTEVKQVQSLIEPGVPLELRTLREVKTLIKQPLDRVLSILARIEAAYWVPPNRIRQIDPTRELVSQQPSQCVVDETMRSQGAAVLGLPWVARIPRDDLRFPSPGTTSLAEWIEASLQHPMASLRLPALLNSLLEADGMTAADEVREMIAAACARCAGKRARYGGEQKRIEILLHRHLSAEGDGLSLEEVAKKYGVTRERIRQVCAPVDRILADHPSSVPALTRVLQAAAALTPCEAGEINGKLYDIIGIGAGIESLLGWAKVIGLKAVPLQNEQTRFRLRGDLTGVRMIIQAGQSLWIVQCLRYASRDCSVLGCTTVMRIAGQLALNDGLAPGQEAIENALLNASGFRWLDVEAGWFTVGDSTSSAAAHRIRKVMAVAHEAIGADQIAAALASDDRWILREASRSFAVPAPHVIRRLLLGWDFLNVVQKGRFELKDDVDRTSSLSPSELLAVGAIESREGVACFFELKDAVMTPHGLTDIAVNVMLGSSPIFIKIEWGLYSLRGRRIGDNALSSARRRLREKMSLIEPSDIPPPYEHLLNVTEALLRNEQYGLPRHRAAPYSAAEVNVVDDSERLIGQVRVSPTGVIHGLNKLFPGVQAGDRFALRFMPSAFRVKLLLSSKSSLPEED